MEPFLSHRRVSPSTGLLIFRNKSGRNLLKKTVSLFPNVVMYSNALTYLGVLVVLVPDVPYRWFSTMKPDEFSHLMALVQAGDANAVGTLLSLFEHEVRIVVRHKLPRRLRVRYDSMDFVQSVYQSIMADWQVKPPDSLQTKAQICAYLQATAHNKVLEIYRRETRTQKYDINREVANLVRGRGVVDSATEKSLEPYSHDPSPSQHAVAKDLMESLTRGKPAVVERILILRQEGCTFEEIGAKVGLSERAVRRILNDLRSQIGESTP
jgi:RNA polymerase sigma factor (sigma-70 family)